MLYWPAVKALRSLFVLSSVYVFFRLFCFLLCKNSVWAMHGEVCSSHDSQSPRNTKREWLGSGTLPVPTASARIYLRVHNCHIACRREQRPEQNKGIFEAGWKLRLWDSWGDGWEWLGRWRGNQSLEQKKESSGNPKKKIINFVGWVTEAICGAALDGGWVDQLEGTAGVRRWKEEP